MTPRSQPTPGSPLPLVADVRHPLYRGTAREEWRLHITLTALSGMCVATAALSLLSPDPGSALAPSVYAVAVLLLGHGAGWATERLWRRTPTHRQPTTLEALVQLAMSAPWVLVGFAGLAGAGVGTLMTGSLQPLVSGLIGLWVTYALRVGLGHHTWRTAPLHLPRSKAHRR